MSDSLFREKKQLEERLSKVNQEIAMLPPTTEKLAELLHSKYCHCNHADQCGWYYESEKDYSIAGTDRNRYLQKVAKMLEFLKIPQKETVLESILSCL